MNRYIQLLIITISVCSSQNNTFPFRESFDTSTALPAGWTSSVTKNSAGDFSVTASTARSTPNAVSSTDATRPQFLVLPSFNFTGRAADSIEFFERRSSTHHARVLVEAALGSDTLFSIRVSHDSLRFISSSSYVRRAFVLPETLSGRTPVRLRVRIIPDTSGTTGVYRIDDVRVTVQKSIDLALSSLSILPAAPRQNDSITVSVYVKNRALSGTFFGTVTLSDSLEAVTHRSFREEMPSGDSFRIELRYPSIKPGRHPLTIRLECGGDEDTTNNTVSSSLSAGYLRGSVLINEFMYLPLPGMPEWIELVNHYNDTIPLTGWRVSDGGSVKALIASSSPILPPGAYCVIATDTSAFKNYFPLPKNLFQASFSSLNNSGDAVVLFDQTLSMIDSLSYLPSWGGSLGRSLERIDTEEGSTAGSNWRTSSHPDGGTPGSINSVTPKQHDAAVVRITTIPLRPIAGKDFAAVVTVRNTGRETTPAVSARLYIDFDHDTILTEQEFVQEQEFSSLIKNDSVQVTMTVPQLLQGIFRLAAKVHFSGDDDSTNDAMMTTLTVGPEPNSIVINEIMPAPSGDSPEWIEGYNRSSDTVRINGWKISDNGTTKAPLGGSVMAIPPKEYVIITTDTVQFLSVYPPPGIILQASFSGLNNTTPDAAVLYDDRNVMMDSIFYRPSWGVNGNVSLQRFDTEIFGSDSMNWRSAPPTPGTANSVARKRIDAEILRAVTSRTAEGLILRVTVRNSGREPVTGTIVRILFSSPADEILPPETIEFLSPNDSASVQFDWPTHHQGTARISIRCESPSDERPENDTVQISAVFPFPPQTMVINEIMYEAFSGEAEFAELLNRSPDTTDVEGWKLLDQPGGSGSRAVMSLSDTMLKIPPNGFMVIASDSTFLSRYPGADRSRIVIRPSLSLSNSGEDLVLVDLTGALIDSVRYSPGWHLRNVLTSGRSLERINPGFSSVDGTNWSTCTAGDGATPLSRNSIYTAAVPARSSIVLSPNPFSPDQDGYEDFLAINYSIPAVSSMIRIRIFDVAGRLVRRLVQNDPSASSGTVLWNGYDDEGRHVRIGMYIIVLEALDNFGGTVRTVKDVAVVARRL